MKQWEVVIGIETHVQLQTNSKIFSGSSTAFGAEPNVQANAVDIALPGVLPVLNKAAVEPDAEARKALLAEFQKIAMTDLPMLPLARPIYVTVASANVRDFITGPEGIRSNYATLSIAK